MTILARSFRLPMPPCGVNKMYRVWKGRVCKADAMRAWQAGVRLLVGNWTPPEHTPLYVGIYLYLAPRDLRRLDADGLVKPIVDAVVTPRCDQWVDVLHVEKQAATGDPEVVVCVRPVKEASE